MYTYPQEKISDERMPLSQESPDPRMDFRPADGAFVFLVQHAAFLAHLMPAGCEDDVYQMVLANYARQLIDSLLEFCANVLQIQCIDLFDLVIYYF